jgi:ElaB/YqjD/DUF883 family membrane-anchored ribosome-binding protein
VSKTVPENDLQDVLRLVARAISGSNQSEEHRKVAVRWLNRLYYDVRQWNEQFIRFLESYPGYRGDATIEEYREFLRQLDEYRRSLDDRYGMAKNDLCTNLKMLAARFTRDFAWLHEEEPAMFHEVREFIDGSYATEANVIRIASTCVAFFYEIPENEEWHLEHHGLVVAHIDEYAESSRQEVVKLHEAAEQVGIRLLTVSEYEAALTGEGSSNPNIVVLGEVTAVGKQVNVTGATGSIINIESTIKDSIQRIDNAPSVPSEVQTELKQLMSELREALAPVAQQSPADAQFVADKAEEVIKEATQDAPKQARIKISARGLQEAAEIVAAIAPTVIAVATKIGRAVAGIG